MAIQVKCPACGCTVAAPDSSAGQMARCGGCRELISVPMSEEMAADLLLDTIDLDSEEQLSRPRAEPLAPLCRRRPNPRLAPPRTRWVLWIVVGIFLVFLILGGATGFTVWYISKPKWQTHEVFVGGFHVELPSPPRDMARLSGVKPEPGVNVFGTARPLSSEEYGVIWADILPGKRMTMSDDALLHEAISEMMKDPEVAEQVSLRALWQNGFPAREIVVRGRKRSEIAVIRIIVAETRLFVVVAGGSGTAFPESENARRFLNSFEITDPLLFEAYELRVHPERVAIRKKEAKRLGDLEFRDTPYEGPPPPDPNTLPAGKPALYLSFDEKGPNVSAVTTSRGTVNCPLPPDAIRAVGVRGAGVFLPPNSQGITMNSVASEVSYGKDGQSICFWAKARGELVTPFSTNYKSPTWEKREYFATYSRPTEVALSTQSKTGFLISAHRKFTRDEKWHNYVFVRHPVPNKGERHAIYIDGKMLMEGQEPNCTFQGLPSELTIGHNWQNNNPVRDVTPDTMFVGLDELAVFHRALSDAEVAYLAGRGPKPDQ